MPSRPAASSSTPGRSPSHTSGPTPRRHARSARTRLGALAGVGTLLVTAACSSGSGDPAPVGEEETTSEGSRSGSIRIQPLFVAGDSGGVGKQTVTREPGEDDEFRLEFSEDEVAGLGDASRAAAWNASIVSTLLTGQPLTGTFGFEVQGRIDGPSAGGLTTIALIALQNGDAIDDGVTMTGTINATGSIGPVGGIPEKVRGAGEAGIEKVLIPLGQRNTTDASGKTVDVVRAGQTAGVEVVEVGDVYEAYPLLTGEELEAPRSGGDPRLDNRSYDKTVAQNNATFARYRDAQREFRGLNQQVQQVLQTTGVVAEARTAFEEANDLQGQGLVAGAYSKAQEAAMYMETLAAGGDLLTPLFTQGLPGLDAVIDRAMDTSSAESRFTAFLDQLATFEPQQVPDIEAVTVAYARAFDAYTLLDFSKAELGTLRQEFTSATGPALAEKLFTTLVTAALYGELSKTMITAAESSFELARDNPGPDFDTEQDLRPVGDFFRRGADANYAAFTTSGLIPQIAEDRGASVESVISGLSTIDLNVAAAAHQQKVLPAFEEYLGADSPNATYAAMGYGVSNYVRNQLLVEKYYNNAELDQNLQVVGVRYQGALNNSLDLGRDQLGSEIGALEELDAAPLLTIGSYESAGLLAGSSDPNDDFNALYEYGYGYLTARLMQYAAGEQDSTAVS